MKKKKTALVTGSNGFIGSHLSLALTKKRIKVIGFSHTKKSHLTIKSFPLKVLFKSKEIYAVKKVSLKYSQNTDPTIVFTWPAKPPLRKDRMIQNRPMMST